MAATQLICFGIRLSILCIFVLGRDLPIIVHAIIIDITMNIVGVTTIVRGAEIEDDDVINCVKAIWNGFKTAIVCIFYWIRCSEFCFYRN